MKVVKAVVAVVDVPRSAKERLKVPWPGTLGRPNLACLSTWKTWAWEVILWDLPRAKVACRVAASLPAAG